MNMGDIGLYVAEIRFNIKTLALEETSANVGEIKKGTVQGSLCMLTFLVCFGSLGVHGGECGICKFKVSMFFPPAYQFIKVGTISFI